MLASMTACQNDDYLSDLQFHESVVNESQKESSKDSHILWDTPSDDPYAMDGYIHITPKGVYYMGDILPSSESDDAKEAIYAYQNSVTSRRARRYCSASSGGVTTSLIVVTGDGRPDTYWIVYSYPDGGVDVAQWENPSMFDCGWLHIQNGIF